MNKNLLILPIIISSFNQTAVSQKSIQSNSCYSEEPFKKEKVFKKMLHKPYFKGGNDSLVNYLMTSISFQNLVNDLSKNERSYSDTARIKFIVSKDGSLSDLTVTSIKRKLFGDKIVSAIKNSSCNWVAGGTERSLNGWLQFDIYYSIDRRFNGVTTIVQIRDYDFATD